MKKQNKVLILVLIISILLVSGGCTNNKVSELESEIESYNEEIVELQNGINQIKFNSAVIKSYIDKSELLDELFDNCEFLYGYVRLGYIAKGYEVGMMNLGAAKSRYEIIPNDIDYSEKNSNLLIETAKNLEIEDMERLEDLKKIDGLLSAMEKEYLNAYEQMENYIKTGDNKYIENYKLHEDNIFELHLEATPIAKEGINLFYDKIMDYNY